MTVATDPEKSLDASIEVTEEERELVRRMKSGEESAFEEFISEYVPGLYRFAGNRLRDQPDLVRDIVQSTVCRIVEKLDTYRGEAPLIVWMYALCRNEIAGHFRRAKSRPAFEVVDQNEMEAAEIALGEVPENPETALIRSETQSQVHLTLDLLSPRYAAALEWKYLHGETVGEIARRLEVSPKAAESLLTRARTAFQTIHAGLAEKRS